MKWFTPADILSYGRLVNIVTGDRGGGKTFNTLLHCCNQFENKGRQFIYLRRYETELDDVKGELFSDLHKHGYISGDWMVKGRDIYCAERQAGFCMALSTSRRLKSKAFPDVYNILFDEFIIDTGRTPYVKDEVRILLDLLETAGRLKDIRLFMLSNAVTTSNPYFDYWGITIPRGARFIKHPTKPIVVQMYHSDELKEAKLQTQYGQLINGTSYGEYNMDNRFVNDNYDFVEGMSGSGNYLYTIYYQGKAYGVYHLVKRGIYHINTNANTECPTSFACTTEDHQPNRLLFKSIRSNPYIKRLAWAFETGNVRFDTLSTKTAIYDLLGYLK